MTWDHPRGFAPMAATAARFQELHPHVTIQWEKRSLKAFEDFPIEQLAAEYDLVVLDHPSIAHAARAGVLRPLDKHLPAAFLADQRAHSTGASHDSYAFDGHHWALAIDAAAPVAAWREDLLRAAGVSVPRTWDDVLTLAQQGRVEVPSTPINCLMNFFGLALARGTALFGNAQQVVTSDVGAQVLLELRDLLSRCDAGIWTRNPISSLDLMASAGNTTLAYCPFTYGYSNYSRDGFAAHRLAFGETPLVDRRAVPTVLGGAGLAVSAIRPLDPAAFNYALWVASGDIQRTLYTESGGQPGYRDAWTDARLNVLTHDYFSATLPVLDRAWVRPRFEGYIDFQERASTLVHAALRGQLPDSDALAQIDRCYQETRAVSAHSR